MTEAELSPDVPVVLPHPALAEKLIESMRLAGLPEWLRRFAGNVISGGMRPHVGAYLTHLNKTLIDSRSIHGGIRGWCLSLNGKHSCRLIGAGPIGRNLTRFPGRAVASRTGGKARSSGSGS